MTPEPTPLVTVLPCEDRVILPPDETDVRLLMEGTLPGCPCCGGTATTFSRFFEHSGIYQAYVHCSHCDVQVFKNARDHEEARQLAIATWSKRPTATAIRALSNKTGEGAQDAAGTSVGPGYSAEPGHDDPIINDIARKIVNGELESQQ
jgi:hypothetical protein